MEAYFLNCEILRAIASVRLVSWSIIRLKNLTWKSLSNWRVIELDGGLRTFEEIEEVVVGFGL